MAEALVFVCFQPERIDPPDPSRPDYDIRADVWSLGISLVSEVLTCMLCFHLSVLSVEVICVCVWGWMEGGAALPKLEFVLVPHHSLHFLLHTAQEVAWWRVFVCGWGDHC